jgi:salicylate hydroxylase
MDKRLVSIEENPSGGVTLTFDDGTMFDADAVVGADGIKSKTRQILLGPDNADAKPKYSGEFGYRSLVPMDKAVDVLGEDFAKNGNVNISDGALTTTYPVEKGTMLNVVAARDKPTWDDPSWVVPADKETVEEDFKGTGPQMQKIVSLLEDPQKWSLWHHPEAATFYRGRFCIIGDAAHAATPHQGAGAGQAFEDALVLAKLLADENIKTADDIEQAFAAFDAIRRPRTLKIVDTSRENGEICMKKGEETGADLTKIKKNLEKRFDWIWYDDLNGQVEEARGKLREIKGPENFLEDLRAPSQRHFLDESTVEASYRPAILRNESLSQMAPVAAPVVKV